MRKTQKIYYAHPYAKTLTAQIVRVHKAAGVMCVLENPAYDCEQYQEFVP